MFKKIVDMNDLKNEFIKYNLVYVDILKIDTEGFEFDIIRGAGDKLKLIKFILFQIVCCSELKFCFQNLTYFEKIGSFCDLTLDITLL